MMYQAVHAIGRDFTVADMEKKCPAVSRDMIRTVLKAMQKAGVVECIGRGHYGRKRVVPLKEGNNQIYRNK